MAHHLLPQELKPCGAINGPTFAISAWKVTIITGSPKSCATWRIDLPMAPSCLCHALLRNPDSVAQREIDSDAILLFQQFFGLFEGEFGSVNALSGGS